MKFIKTNLFLSIMLLFSVFFVIKFSEFPSLFGSESIFTKVFLKPQINTAEYEFYRLLENLSLAYIASFIFYLMVDFFPKEKMAKKSFEIIRTDMVELHTYMSEVIASFMALLGITKDINCIEPNDLQALDTVQIKNERFFYKSYTIIDGIKNKAFSREFFDYHKDAPKCVKIIKNKIRNIKNFPCSSYVNYDILGVLSSIESNGFLNQVQRLRTEMMRESNNITRANFGVNFYSFIQDYRKLNEFSFKKDACFKIPMSDDEIKQYLVKINNVSQMITKMPESNQSYKVYLGNDRIS